MQNLFTCVSLLCAAERQQDGSTSPDCRHGGPALPSESTQAKPEEDQRPAQRAHAHQPLPAPAAWHDAGHGANAWHVALRTAAVISGSATAATAGLGTAATAVGHNGGGSAHAGTDWLRAATTAHA